MPTSSWDRRQWFTDRIADTTSELVVDVGPGEGTYSILGRHLRWDARWLGIEIFEPYVDRFMLGQKYDDVIVGDVRDWTPPPFGYTILFGDVLEHMPREDAVALLKLHLECADEIYVSVPIVESVQGECFGNEHETHVHQWTYDEMSDLLPDADRWEGSVVGRWWWKRITPIGLAAVS